MASELRKRFAILAAIITVTLKAQSLNQVIDPARADGPALQTGRSNGSTLPERLLPGEQPVNSGMKFAISYFRLLLEKRTVVLTD